MLTIFSCPKPFTDPHIATIQRNAIASWASLTPRPEIILFGNEEGVEEISREFGARHVADISRNEFGTPLLDDFFRKAESLAEQKILCYINADMILMSDFSKAVKRLKEFNLPFVLSGARWNLALREPLACRHPHWEEVLRERVKREGGMYFWGNDYFVFSRGLYQEMPPLAIGRGWLDGWLFWKALSQNAALIDATPSVVAVHQDHGYAHIEGVKEGGGFKELSSNEEGKRNYELADVAQHWVLLDQATHVMTRKGIRKVWVPGRIWRFRLQYGWRGSKIVRFLIEWSAPLRHALGLRFSHSKSTR